MSVPRTDRGPRAHRGGGGRPTLAVTGRRGLTLPLGARQGAFQALCEAHRGVAAVSDLSGLLRFQQDLLGTILDVQEDRGACRRVAATLSRQAAIVDALDGLDAQVAALARQLAELADEDGEQEARYYQPVPPPRYRELPGMAHQPYLKQPGQVADVVLGAVAGD